MKSKNVLVTIPYLVIGGTEIQTLNLVRALIDGGYNVSVLCLYRHIESTVSMFKDAGAKVYMASPQYDRYGIDIKYPKGIRLILFLYKHLRRIIREEKIDIVHVQYMAPGLSLIMVLRYLLFQRNIIATAHTAADIYKGLRPIYFIQRHCLRAFTCITERAERSFFGTSQLYTTETVLGKRNHFTIYNALPKATALQSTVNGQQTTDFSNQRDNTEFRHDDENLAAELQTTINVERETCNEKTAELYENVDENLCQVVSDTTTQKKNSAMSAAPSLRGRAGGEAPILGVVSRLEPIKGMDLVVPAFAEVRKRFPEVRLLVVGDGSLRATMEQQAAELGCADRITWVGRQPQEELNRWYGQMDIVLMPSRSEGFGLTAIEAMANGCVMVASNVGGLPEVVRNGVCGLLHRTEDVQDMAEKISALLGDNELYDKLRAQSLIEVEKYSFERYAESICDLYSKICNEP